MNIKLYWIREYCLLTNKANTYLHAAWTVKIPSEFPLCDAYLHAARSPQHGWKLRIVQISTFPLKTIYLIMRTHDPCVEVCNNPCSMPRVVCSVLRVSCFVEVWIGQSVVSLRITCSNFTTLVCIYFLLAQKFCVCIVYFKYTMHETWCNVYTSLSISLLLRRILYSVHVWAAVLVLV